MSTITNVKQIPGFNQEQYAALIETAKSSNVDAAVVDMALLQAVKGGKDFAAALKSVAADLPELVLPFPNALNHLGSLGAAPSPGATVMALIVGLTGEERKENAQMRADQTQLIASKIEDQASEMRSKAAMQLAMGVVSGAISIAQGAATMAVQAKGMQKLDALRDGAKIAENHNLPNMAAEFTHQYQTGMSALTAQVNAVSSGISGINTMVDSVGQAAGTFFDADIKEMEADVERQRAARDALKSLDDGLAQLIQKTLSSMDAIQQGMNQTRTRILG